MNSLKHSNIKIGNSQLFLGYLQVNLSHIQVNINTGRSSRSLSRHLTVLNPSDYQVTRLKLN